MPASALPVAAFSASASGSFTSIGAPASSSSRRANRRRPPPFCSSRPSRCVRRRRAGRRQIFRQIAQLRHRTSAPHSPTTHRAPSCCTPPPLFIIIIVLVIVLVFLCRPNFRLRCCIELFRFTILRRQTLLLVASLLPILLLARLAAVESDAAASTGIVFYDAWHGSLFGSTPSTVAKGR